MPGHAAPAALAADRGRGCTRSGQPSAGLGRRTKGLHQEHRSHSGKKSVHFHYKCVPTKNLITLAQALTVEQKDELVVNGFLQLLRSNHTTGCKERHFCTLCHILCMKFTPLQVTTTSQFVKIILFKLFTMVDAEVNQ